MGQSAGSTLLEAIYWAQQDSASNVLCGLLVPFIFLPVSDVRIPVQSNIKTPDSSELK